MNIHFEKASYKYLETIFHWLQEPHVKAFWDNSQAHKNDILNFINGRKEPSDYCDGLYTYWIGFIDSRAYCLIMTLQEKPEYTLPAIKKIHLSSTGNTYSMDFMIGDKECVSKGMGAMTLQAFIEFFLKNYDPQADTFFIDPDINNIRARHVYEKAGFEYRGDFMMEGEGVFAGHMTHFFMKKININNDE